MGGVVRNRHQLKVERERKCLAGNGFPVGIALPEKKECPRCLETFPIAEFLPKNGSLNARPRTYCVKCANKYYSHDARKERELARETPIDLQFQVDEYWVNSVFLKKERRLRELAGVKKDACISSINLDSLKYVTGKD